MTTAVKYNEGRFYLAPEQFNISYLKYTLGYPPDQELPQDIRISLDQQVYPNLLRAPIRYWYRVFPILHQSDKHHLIGLTPEITLQGPVIFQLLKHCSDCLVFILDLTGMVEDSPESEFLSYSFFNTLTQTAMDHFKEEVVQNLGIQKSLLTRRFEPGYCGWAIEEKQKIMVLFKLDSAGGPQIPAQEDLHLLTGIYGLRRKTGQQENIPCYTCTSVTCALQLDFLESRLSS